jgi:hypothetical protein
MKLRLNPSIVDMQTIAVGAPTAKPPETVSAPGDGIDISNVFAALDQTARIGRVAAAVQAGSYQVSSTATGNAIVEDALAALSERKLT